MYLPTCHSTNTYANNWLKENEVEEGWIVYTFDQTNGRGQAGNTWESEPNKNLTFSIVYTPVFLAPKNQFYLNMIVSLAIVAFLEQLNLKAEIKWPNDIYVNGKKMAGILIENHLRGDVFRNAVVGIGLNINQANFKTAKASSVFQELGIEYQLTDCISILRTHLEQLYEHLKSNELLFIQKEYLQKMYLRNKPSLFRSGDHTFIGSIKGVDPNGRLLIMTELGEKTFGLKEIAFLNS